MPYGDPQPDRWFRVGFEHPLDVPYVDIYPVTGIHGRTTSVAVGSRVVPVHPGWNRITINAHHISSLRIAIASVLKPSKPGPGGIQEVRIPGVQIRPLLRAPLLVGKALAGRDTSHAALSYLFARMTGDDPFRRDRYVDAPGLSNLVDKQDAETAINRVVFEPAARSYAVDARVEPAPEAPDSLFDRLVGVRSVAGFTSSSRFHNDPAYRASSAFDGTAGTAWVGLWIRPTDPLPWIGWDAGRTITVRQLRLTPTSLPVRRPTRVELSWSGGSTGALPVGADGRVALPGPVRARSFRLTILDAAFPAGLTAREQFTRGVGIGELTVPGVAPVRIPSAGALHSACGDVHATVAGRDVSMRVVGTIAQLDAGRPLPAQACGGLVTMPAGIQYVSTSAEPFSVDLLRLRSPAPSPVAASPGGGTVVNPGQIGRYSVSGVRLNLPHPGWVVLGESFDTGWQATCDGHSLGTPQVIDGFANGWLAPAGCQRVTFMFAPQNGVNRSYVISAVIVALLALLLVFTRPPRLREEDHLSPLLDVPAARTPMPLRRAIPLAIALALPLSFIFAWRSALFIAPVLAIVFWRGIGPRPLAAASASLIAVAIPIEYVIAQPNNEGGYNFGFSVDVIYAHWIGVVAVILLGLSGWFTLSAARGPRAGRLPPPPSDRRESGPLEEEHDGAPTRSGQPRDEPEPAIAN